jgi:fermentation-respiration switch protein FrsA (DUF1100 family)
MVTISLCVYFGFSLILFLFQDHFVFYPHAQIEMTPKDALLEFEKVHIPSHNEVVLHGWWVPAKNELATVIFFHGNAGNISHRLSNVQILHDLNLSVLIFDYAGYGISSGKPSEQQTYHDAQAAWDYLTKEKKSSARKIILMGQSLGGAIATHLAAKETPDLLIVESAFTSVPDMAQHIYKIFPTRLIAKIHYPTAEAILRVKCPVLIIHSSQDELVPFAMGQKLFTIAPSPKTFLEISGTHNEGFLTSGAVYSDGIRDFIRKNLR